MEHWHASKNYFWETAPFFRLLLPLIIIIISYDKHLLPAANNSILAFVLSLALLLTITTLLSNKPSHSIDIFRTICIYASVSIVAWLLCCKSDIRNEAAWFGNHLDAESYEVTVSDAPLERGKTWKVKVVVDKAYVEGTIIQTTGPAFVYIYKDYRANDLHKGDVVIIPNKWDTIKNAGNPYEFNYRAFCNRSNIFYHEFISSGDVLIRKRASYANSFVDRIHDWAMLAFSRYIDDRKTLGLLQAMLLGDDINFDQETRQAYTETGIIHIIAISGGHLVVFFQIISLFLFWLPNKKYEHLKYLLALPFISLYVIVAGAPVSAIRAAIMFSCTALGFILQKDKQPLNQLFTTAFFMLLYEPMWLFAVGFQLSFAAVLSLILFYQPLYGSIPIKNQIVKKIWGAITATLAAEIIIAPIVVYYFHLLPVAFLFTNVIACLFMSMVMVAGILLVIVSGTLLATYLANVVGCLVACVNTTITFFQKMNPGGFKHLYLSLFELTVVYIIVAGLGAFLIVRQRKGIYVGLAAVCLLLFSLIIDKWQSLNQLQFIAYNIRGERLTEIISGNRYFSVANENSNRSLENFATREFHIASRAWEKKTDMPVEVIIIKGQKLLVLDHPIENDTLNNFDVDYLMLNYQAQTLDVKGLQKVFHFKKLIFGSNQKMYLAERWKDSCNKYHIPVHLIASDGAFILK